jgi:O-acetyl-ADP-ribose deacetylase (regulator of RNase III)
MTIKYIKGDATQPQGEGLKIIAHVCNDIGAWGAGFVVALSKRWKQPEAAFRQWYKPDSKLPLGEVQFVKVEPDIIIANMIGQSGIYKDKNGLPPVRYEAIRAALQKVATYALANKASFHAPRFGAGLAGGKWEIIEKLIEEEVINKGIEVTIYDFV